MLTRAFIDAAVEAGYELNPDFNGPIQKGVNCYEVMQKNGERSSATRAYLHPVLRRPNLTMHTGAHVVLQLEGKRATGVDYLMRGRPTTAFARREVAVSAGAINSPQLLLLSGIGPEGGLQEHGIPVRATGAVDNSRARRCRPTSSGCGISRAVPGQNLKPGRRRRGRIQRGPCRSEWAIPSRSGLTSSSSVS
ncbi:GMC family oxidoreductase N-terminal domain-containing protein [Massilia sp. MS-15]|uniref:GMC family oxidoreductase N-terminal domain-containing protein n=1 Tax=Massilia sp. MS-15 TaxID=2878200 RepID=UPI001CD42D30|nr:GMC family oxidoreductase N-terminal domain-containing protein [Massilia sp. MS-15]